MATNTHPSSYNSLAFQTINVSHVPPSAPSPTPVILITLNRPHAHNAFTNQMSDDLVKIFDTLSSDDRVRAIVLTGAGRMFCAGADLDAGRGLSQNNVDTNKTHRDSGGRTALSIYRCQKPVIAAINGSAVGIGITMTLPASIRIASNKAKIGFVFARRGLIMEAASSFFLPRLVGLSRAMHLTTTGSVYPATDPLLRELFSEVVDPEKVLPRALELADEIAKNTSIVSTQVMKELMWRNPGTPEEAHLLDSKLIFEMFAGPDKLEGVMSFLEKRKAEFKGTMKDNAPSAFPWWTPIDVKAPGKDNAKSKL